MDVTNRIQLMCIFNSLIIVLMPDVNTHPDATSYHKMCIKDLCSTENIVKTIQKKKKKQQQQQQKKQRTIGPVSLTWVLKIC